MSTSCVPAGPALCGPSWVRPLPPGPRTAGWLARYAAVVVALTSVLLLSPDAHAATLRFCGDGVLHRVGEGMAGRAGYAVGTSCRTAKRVMLASSSRRPAGWKCETGRAVVRAAARARGLDPSNAGPVSFERVCRRGARFTVDGTPGPSLAVSSPARLQGRRLVAAACGFTPGVRVTLSLAPWQYGEGLIAPRVATVRSRGCVSFGRVDIPTTAPMDWLNLTVSSTSAEQYTSTLLDARGL